MVLSSINNENTYGTSIIYTNTETDAVIDTDFIEYKT